MTMNVYEHFKPRIRKDTKICIYTGGISYQVSLYIAMFASKGRIEVTRPQRGGILGVDMFRDISNYMLVMIFLIIYQKIMLNSC